MREAFFNLMYEDRRARFRIYLGAVLGALGWSAIQYLYGVPARSVQNEAGLVTLLLAFLQILWYVGLSTSIPALARKDGLPRREIVKQIAAPIGVSVVFLNALPRIEGLLFGWVLLGSARGELDDRKLQEIQHLATNAKQNEVATGPDVTVQVGGKVLDATKQPSLAPTAWQTAETLAEYKSFAASKRTRAGPVQSESVGDPGQEFSTFPGGTISNSRLTRFNVALDGANWRDCEFIDCMVRYGGGITTRLQNVKFRNCRFQVSRNPHGFEFVAAVLRAPAEDLTVFFIAE
jgi:hypothetical protein